MSPVPPQFRPKSPDSSVSVEEAISVLERAASTPRAHAAINTLRAELNVGDQRKQNTNQSPGQQAASRSGQSGGFPAALARMGGK